jgi:endonuclease YncB( thermonuclease family)
MNARPLRGALPVFVSSFVFVGILMVLLAACDSAASTSEAVSAVEAPLVERGGALYVDEPDRLLLGQVEHVIDGDTLDVTFDGKTERVRVFGIAAAERDQRCYLEATDELRALAGSEVRVLPDDRREDDFGRWLRYLFTPDGRSIDAALVASGAVEAWRDDGAYRDDLVALESEARRAGRGCLWR